MLSVERFTKKKQALFKEYGNRERQSEEQWIKRKNKEKGKEG
jgi:hypothetical protein